MSRRFRAIAIVAVSTALSFAAASLALEAFCRYRKLGVLQRTGRDGGLNYRPNDVRLAKNIFLGWEYNPAGFMPRCAGYKVNSLGLLDKEYPLAKDKKTYRIIIVGDSITAQGWYAKELERLLNSAGLPLKYEVWNCGVGGYAVGQYYHYLVEKAPLFKPDMVIVGFCLNDFSEFPIIARGRDGRFSTYLSPVNDFSFHERPLPINRTLFFSSYAYRYLICSLQEYTTRNNKNAGSCENAVRKISDYTARGNIKLCGVIIPYLKSKYAASEQQDYNHIRYSLAACRWRFLDLHGCFSDPDDPGLREAPWDRVHLSEQGHKIIAGKIFAYLMRDKVNWLQNDRTGSVL